ncbi:hypothetical protein [Streptosporangium canum]|uniref:hypothetical protein n=1 Tax=Streptosporangium canum TaxID=324952 RepID=UPI00379AC17F
MNKEEVILAIIGGLVVNECCDLSPWVARRIVAWSARLRYGKSQRSEIRAEELAAVIDSRPGKLFKLITALLFVTGATGTRLRQALLLVFLAGYIAIEFPVYRRHKVRQAARDEDALREQSLRKLLREFSD